MFAGSVLIEVRTIEGHADPEGRWTAVYETVKHTVRGRLAPISEEERSQLRPVHDVTTAVIIGDVECNPQDVVVAYVPEPLHLRIEAVHRYGNRVRRLLCSTITTPTADERRMGVRESQSDVMVLAQHPARYDLKLWIGHSLEGAAYLPR